MTYICSKNATQCEFYDSGECHNVEDCASARVKRTNADRIRAMSDEELARFIDDIETSKVEMWHGFCDICDAKECWRCTFTWLKQESEVGR